MGYNCLYMDQVGLLDCNNFFVSCERLFRPDLVGKPVVVLSSNDGCIVARSQEVKTMGVPMGIPLFQARQLVDMSQVTLFSSNFPLYRDLSLRVMQALKREVGSCEVYSIDESFFSLPAAITESEVAAIRAAVTYQTGIPVSIGVGATKTLAKVGSKLAKKSGGVRIVSKTLWQTEASVYPLEDIWNLGRATAKRLRTYDIATPAAFMALSRAWVLRQFGVLGCRLYDELHGISAYGVDTHEHDIAQSIASTRSFAHASNERSALESAVAYHLTHVAEKLRQQDLVPSWLTIELRPSRHGDFAYRKGSVTVPLSEPTNSTTPLLKSALAGLAALYEPRVPYKKAGVTAGGLIPASYVQPMLLGATSAPTEEHALDTVADTINQRFGVGTVRPAIVLDTRLKSSAALRSPSYTTVWKDIPRVHAS